MSTAMQTSMNFASKGEFRKAVQQGLPIILYSPTLAVPAINGPAYVTGPWHPSPLFKEWHAQVRVKDMRVVEVD